jgi:hypothetical protein
MDADKLEICQFATLREGRGVFTYTPVDGKQKVIAEIEYSEKKYRFDLPAGLPQGVVMEVDNLSFPDSIGITLRKNMNTPSEILGMVVTTAGKLQNYCYIYITDKELIFKLDKMQLPSGVSQIVLFNSKGEILCDRMIFNNRNMALLDIKVKTGKPAYQPHELVDMEISIADRDVNPDNLTFSLSIRDGANEIENNHNILTDLLLMSEIKGYVRNPSWYFEEDDNTRRSALDVLLMVQGWRRYSWKQMTGMEPFEWIFLPEQGIEITGRVISSSIFGKQTPKSDVDVNMLLHKQDGENETGGSIFKSFITDPQGQFSFVSDVDGKWNMIM